MGKTTLLNNLRLGQQPN